MDWAVQNWVNNTRNKKDKIRVVIVYFCKNIFYNNKTNTALKKLYACLFLS